MNVGHDPDFALPMVDSGPTGFRLDLIALSACWSVLLLVILMTVPKVEMIMKDFGIAVGMFTKVIFTISHLPIAVIGLVAIGASLQLFLLNKRSQTIKPGGPRPRLIPFLAVPLLLLTLAVVALVIPLVDLVSRLSG